MNRCRACSHPTHEPWRCPVWEDDACDCSNGVEPEVGHAVLASGSALQGRRTA